MEFFISGLLLSPILFMAAMLPIASLQRDRLASRRWTISRQRHRRRPAAR